MAEQNPFEEMAGGKPVLDLKTEQMWCKSHWALAMATGTGKYSIANIGLFTALLEDKRFEDAIEAAPGPSFEEKAQRALGDLWRGKSHACCFIAPEKLQTVLYLARQGKPYRPQDKA